ncbi:MAG: zeta toxin family protein [Pyrinomonadaceae bacterium]
MPHVIVIAGPNGAGKSTIAPFLLRDKLGVTEFVNADIIAQGLSAYSPEKAALAAGRIMLNRIGELVESEENFAFETTLSSRTFVQKLRRMQESGYDVSVVFLWLASEDLAILRVAERVKQGGHHIPAKTIRRRFQIGLKNFFQLYRNLADNWYFYDNSDVVELRLIASGNSVGTEMVFDELLWNTIKLKYENQDQTRYR